MKTAWFTVRILVGALLFAGWGTAHGYWIGLAPPSISTLQNNTFSVDILISGLATEQLLLSAYDFSLGYDQSILQLQGAQSNGALGAGSIFGSVPSPGSINLFEIALLADAQLAAQQSDLFILATLTFMAIGVGTSPIAFTGFAALGGAQVLDPILGPVTMDLLALPHTVGSSSVTVGPSAVPEPTTLFLLALALPLLLLHARRHRA